MILSRIKFTFLLIIFYITVIVCGRKNCELIMMRTLLKLFDGSLFNRMSLNFGERHIKNTLKVISKPPMDKILQKNYTILSESLYNIIRACLYYNYKHRT